MVKGFHCGPYTHHEQKVTFRDKKKNSAGILDELKMMILFLFSIV